MPKDILEHYMTIDVDDSGGTPRDLTISLVPGSFTGGGITFNPVNMTGVSQTVENFLAGRGTAEITAQFFLDDTATTGSHTVLSGNDGGTGTITVQYGTDGVPAGSDPEWEGEYVYLGGSVVNVGGAWARNYTFQPTGATAPAFGTV